MYNMHRHSLDSSMLQSQVKSDGEILAIHNSKNILNLSIYVVHSYFLDSVVKPYVTNGDVTKEQDNIAQQQEVNLC